MLLERSPAYNYNIVFANALRKHQREQIFNQTRQKLLASYRRQERDYNTMMPQIDYQLRELQQMTKRACYQEFKNIESYFGKTMVQWSAFYNQKLKQFQRIQLGQWQAKQIKDNNYFIATLDFWNLLLAKQFYLELHQLEIMIKIFCLYLQFGNISYFKQTYSFISIVIEYMNTNKILSPQTTLQCNVIFQKKGFLSFIALVQNHIGKNLKKLHFIEVGIIIVMLKKLNHIKKGLFYDLFGEEQQIIEYLNNLYKLFSLKGIINLQAHQMFVILSAQIIQSNKNFQLLQRHKIMSILEVVVQKCLYYPDYNLFQSSIYLLSSFIDLYKDKMLLHMVYERISFIKLANSFNNRIEKVMLIKFSLLVLQTFPQNQVISQGILVQYYIQSKLRQLIWVQDGIKSWYSDLVDTIFNHSDFYIKKHPNVCAKILYFGLQLQFEFDKQILEDFFEEVFLQSVPYLL